MNIAADIISNSEDITNEFDNSLKNTSISVSTNFNDILFSQSRGISPNICYTPATPQLRKSQLRYLDWKGNNTFFCWGAIIMGSQYEQAFLTAFLVIITWTAYTFLVIPFRNSTIEIFIAICLFVVNISSLFCAALTEPGIIPRCTSETILKINPISYTYLRRHGASLNYCSVCKIIKPPRTKHCRYCDNCVQVFDHHCPWLGNCIGVRNYLYFLVFIISVTLGSLFVLETTTLILVEIVYRSPSSRPIYRLVGMCIMIPWSLAITVFAGSLLLLHIILLYRCQTTTEFFRGVHPHQSGIFHSFVNYVSRNGRERTLTLTGDSPTTTQSSMISTFNARSVDLTHELMVRTYATDKYAWICPPKSLLLPMNQLPCDEIDSKQQSQLLAELESAIRDRIDRVV